MPEQARERAFSPPFESSGAHALGVPDSGSNLAASKPGTGQTDFDVIVVGAGLSGIGVGYHLQRDCPRKSFVILEARGAIGGTWDLFRYPGIRSDSDMYTLGYRFRPWHGESSFADGASILEYLGDTAREYGIDRKIRYRHKVTRASWSSSEARWRLEVSGPDGKALTFTCNFLQLCSGYYDYDAGYMPGWPDMDRFKGEIVHPQEWPDGLDYTGKRVVVIGSGATAVTMVPALTDKAAHVTMLQRSPSYIVARPAKDSIASWLYARLPERLAYRLARWKNIFLQTYFYNAARRKPEAAKEYIIELAEEELGPGIDVEKHFTPRYNPWDQRLCLVPDGDLFKAIREGRASVVTDEIETFSETGLKLRSGDELPADIIVCATGLVMRLMGGIELVVDGRIVNPGATMIYKGVMLSDVPNLALTFGYASASWTLKADLVAEYLCRVLNKMDRDGYAYCTPRSDPSVIAQAILPLSSGYMQRAKEMLPKQGPKRPWTFHQNYARDMLSLRFGPIDDGVLTFVRCAEWSGKR